MTDFLRYVRLKSKMRRKYPQLKRVERPWDGSTDVRSTDKSVARYEEQVASKLLKEKTRSEGQPNV